MRVRERSGSIEEPHEQELAAQPRAKNADTRSGDHASYRDAYAQAVLLPPPVYEDTERWSTLLAEDPIFGVPAAPSRASVASLKPPLDPDATLDADLDTQPGGPLPEPTPKPDSELELDALDVVPGPASVPPEGLPATLEAQPPATLPPPIGAESAPQSERIPVSQPRSSGHFEDSVARAVETLDASTILTGAGTDLKRRGNLLSTHAKKREEPARLLRSRTPRSGSPAVAHPESESTTTLQTEGPTETEALFFAEPERVVKPKRRMLVPVVALASVAVGIAVTFALANNSNTTTTTSSSASGDVASSVPASKSGTAGPTTTSPPSARDTRVVPATSLQPSALGYAEVAPAPKQPRTHGVLRVDSNAPGRVFVQGIDIGPTGAFLELTCGMKFVRIAHESPPPPGQSFPNWIGEAKSVMVPCGQAHRVEFTP